MRAGRTAGSNHRVRGRLAAAGVVACVTALSVAPGAFGSGSGRESNSKTVTLGARSTKTIDVGYPHALEFSGARYTCQFHVTGVDPGKVKILFHGSALGGTVCRVKAHNPSAPSIDASVTIKVTATTISGGLG
jgi:hypothetical protein